MQLTNYSTDLITPKDISLIEQMINENPDRCILFYKLRLTQSIKNITPDHYIVLGYMIGLIHATEKTLEDFHYNNNPLTKCRAN